MIAAIRAAQRRPELVRTGSWPWRPGDALTLVAVTYESHDFAGNPGLVQGDAPADGQTSGHAHRATREQTSIAHRRCRGFEDLASPRVYIDP